jgi:hypothetical protein
MRVPLLDDFLDWLYGVEFMEVIRNGPYDNRPDGSTKRYLPPD